MYKISLFFITVLYVAAGVNHFLHPAMYRKIMPPWIGWHNELVAVSGVCEILFGLMLVFPATRQIGAWCITGLLIAVFPANIQMLLNYLHEHDHRLWIAIVRLPVQLILIWWAYGFTKQPASL